ELFDARQQSRVQPLLTTEVLEAVLIQPSRQREKKAALEEDQHRSDDRAVARKPQMGRELPVGVAAQKVGKEQPAVIPSLECAPEHDVDVLVKRGVAVFGGAAACEQPLPSRPSHIVFELAHQAIDFDHYFFFPVKVPPASPPMSIVPFIDAGPSTV